MTKKIVCLAIAGLGLILATGANSKSRSPASETSSTVRSIQSEIDGTYYVSADRLANDITVHESLFIFENGKSHTISIHNGARTDEVTFFSAKSGKISVKANPSNRVYNCNGSIENYKDSTGYASKGTYKISGNKLKVLMDGQVYDMTKATNEQINRIMSLPACQLISK